MLCLIAVSEQLELKPKQNVHVEKVKKIDKTKIIIFICINL